MQGRKIKAGEYQLGIYTVRKERGKWLITVEDGKGFPFDSVSFNTFAGAHQFCTGERP